MRITNYHPNYLKFSYLLLGFLFLAPLSCLSNTIEFSGFEEFWGIYQKLKSDQEPTELDWDQMFDTPGYSFLVDNEGKDKFLRKWLPIVYMPSRKVQLENELAQADGYLKIVLNHLLKIQKKEDELLAFITSLQQNPELLKDIHKKAQIYLPDYIFDTKAPPPISFAIFEPDGKASSNIIVVDALFAMDIDIVGFLAHEAHHYYMPSKLKMPEKDHSDYLLIRSINQLRLEGIADLIDKKGILKKSKPNWYEGYYQKYYDQSPKRFAQMDSLIQVFIKAPDQQTAIAKKIASLLPFGAHPNGFYMAQLIKEHYGRSGILECLENPFTFLYKYQDIALKEAEVYAFSNTTIQLLKSLEKKYIEEEDLKDFDELHTAEVMVVGTHHFRKAELADSNQQSLKKIIKALQEYRPTKVVVEKRAVLQDSFSSTYQQYLKGEYDISKRPNEIFQVGYRLAAAMGHDDIYLFDDKTEFIGSLEGFTFEGFAKYAEEYDKGFYDRHLEVIKEYFNHNQAIIKKASLYDKYVMMNSEASNKFNAQRMHLFENRVGIQKSWIGPDWLGRWYRRNIRMQSIVIKMMEPNDRILIIVGDNHKWILDQLFEWTPEFKVIPSSQYLK